jgi:hypothetical protein
MAANGWANWPCPGSWGKYSLPSRGPCRIALRAANIVLGTHHRDGIPGTCVTSPGPLRRFGYLSITLTQSSPPLPPQGWNFISFFFLVLPREGFGFVQTTARLCFYGLQSTHGAPPLWDAPCQRRGFEGAAEPSVDLLTKADSCAPAGEGCDSRALPCRLGRGALRARVRGPSSRSHSYTPPPQRRSTRPPSRPLVRAPLRRRTPRRHAGRPPVARETAARYPSSGDQYQLTRSRTPRTIAILSKRGAELPHVLSRRAIHPQ